jgi:putative Holliday junction resolvase
MFGERRLTRILGIDYGDRKLGLAISDKLRLTAQPFGIHRLAAKDTDNRRFFENLVAKYDIAEIVIGDPLRMDGSSGTRVEKTREFAAWLESVVHKPIFFIDERLTTQEALHILRDQDVGGKKKKDREDQIAAVIILSTYLERKRSEPHVPQDR